MKQNKQNILAAATLATGILLTSCGDQAEAPKGPGATPPAATAPAAAGAPAAAAPAGDMETITPKFPKPAFQGTPIPPGTLPPNFDTTKEPKKSFDAPKGTANLALGKTVTSSDKDIIIPNGPESVKLLTDGDADSADGCFVELMQGPQWVQVDLGESATLYQILVWHFHKQGIIVKAVIAQISDDPEFKTGVTTVYNSDIDNSCGQGAGQDKVWVQTNHGRLIDAKGTKGRYVRLWSNGNDQDDFNRYIEVEVYGKK
jgi:hypothetical protein